MEVLNFLNNLLKVFEGAGFFFVPILCLMALFDLSQLRKNRGTRSYLLICAVMLFVYLIISESSRYLLIPLLLCGVLAGAGMGAPVKYLHWTGYFKFLKKWHLILLLTIVTICFSCLKLTLRDRSSVMRIFATELRNHPTGKFALCSVNCPQGAKLGSLLRFHPDFEFMNCDNFDDAIDFLTVNNFVDKDIYFFTRIPRNYQVDDFKLWFRGKHSIFPFDIVQIKGERSYRYILMKFNGRTLDGTQAASRYGLLQQLHTTHLERPCIQPK